MSCGKFPVLTCSWITNLDGRGAVEPSAFFLKVRPVLTPYSSSLVETVASKVPHRPSESKHNAGHLGVPAPLMFSME